MSLRAVSAVCAGSLLLAGCRTPDAPPPSSAEPSVSLLDGDETTFSQALAHYCWGCVLDGNRAGLRASLAEFEAATRLDPKHIRTALTVAKRYHDILRKDEDAILILKETCRQQPNALEPRLLLAHIYEGKKDHDRAMTEYAAVIAIAPREASAYMGCASICISRNDELRALEFLRTGIGAASDPRYLLDACNVLAGHFLSTGRNEKARECLQLVHERRPQDHDAVIGLFRCYLAMGKSKEAEVFFRKAMRELKDPKKLLTACKDLSDLYVETHQLEAATACLELLTASPPTDVVTLARLFACYLSAGKKDEASNLARNAPEEMREKPTFHYALGLVFTSAHQYKDAIASFETVDRLLSEPSAQGPDLRDTIFYYRFGAACERDGQLERAETLFRKCIGLDGANDEAQNYLAYMWAEKGKNLAEALDLVLAALEADSGNAAYIDTLGWVYFKQRRYPEALAQIERAHSLTPDDPTVTEHLGDVLSACGRDVEALAVWKESFLMNTDSKSLAEKLTSRGVDVGALKEESRKNNKKE